MPQKTDALAPLYRSWLNSAMPKRQGPELGKVQSSTCSAQEYTCAVKLLEPDSLAETGTELNGVSINPLWADSHGSGIYAPPENGPPRESFNMASSACRQTCRQLRRPGHETETTNPVVRSAQDGWVLNISSLALTSEVAMPLHPWRNVKSPQTKTNITLISYFLGALIESVERACAPVRRRNGAEPLPELAQKSLEP